MAPQPLDFERLMRVPYINPDTGIEISPDGRFVAFSWNRTGQWEIYQLRLDHPDDLRQVTDGPGAKFRPRYSPDSQFLLYALDLDGSESFDICVCNLARKLHFNLTPDTPFAIQPNVCWSPDGKSIAFISNQSGRFSTYVLPLSFSEKVEPAGAPRLVFDQSGPHWDVLWSPDGSYLAVVCESTGSDNATYIIPVPLEYSNDNRRVQPGERIFPKLRVISEQGIPINAKQVFWSPDGARLAFSSDLHGNYDIGIFELASGQVIWVTSGKGDKGSPDWSVDGKRLTYVHCEGPDSWVAVLELGRAAPALYHLEPGVHSSPLFTPDSRRIVFIFDNPRRPDDLWLLNLESGQFAPADALSTARILRRGLYYASAYRIPEPGRAQRAGFALPAVRSRRRDKPGVAPGGACHPRRANLVIPVLVVPANDTSGEPGLGRVGAQLSRFQRVWQRVAAG